MFFAVRFNINRARRCALNDKCTTYKSTATNCARARRLLLVAAGGWCRQLVAQFICVRRLHTLHTSSFPNGRIWEVTIVEDRMGQRGWGSMFPSRKYCAVGRIHAMQHGVQTQSVQPKQSTCPQVHDKSLKVRWSLSLLLFSTAKYDPTNR